MSALYECCKCAHRFEVAPQVGTTTDHEAPLGFQVFEHYMAECPKGCGPYIRWLNFEQFEVKT